MTGVALCGYSYLAGKYNLGAEFCRGVHVANGYIGKVKDAIKKVLADKFQNIKITREYSDDPNLAVFKFNRVHIVNTEKIDKILEISEKKSVLIEEFNENIDLSIQEFKEILSEQSYEILLKLDKGKRLGEIDFADWVSEDGFQVEVIRKGKLVDNNINQQKLSPDSSEYQQVIQTLRKMAKVTGKYSPLDGIEKFPENNWTNYLKSFIGNDNPSISLDLLGELNERLVSLEYINNIQQLAASKLDSEKKKMNILDNYFEVIEQAKKNELLHKKRLHKELEIRRVQYEISKTDHKKFWITLGIAGVVGALLTVGGLVALNMFLPGVGAVVTPLVVGTVVGVASFVGTKLSNVFGGILGLGGITSAVIMSTKTIPEWRKEEKRLLNEQISECKSIESALEQDLKDLKNHRVSSKRVMESIVNFNQSLNSDILNLSSNKKNIISNFLSGTMGKFCSFFGRTEEGKIGDIAINLISHAYNSDTDVGNNLLSRCRVLNLENNNITKVGAGLISNILVEKQLDHRFNLQVLYLKGNPLGQAGLQELQIAMEKNITITELTYDLPRKNIQDEKLIADNLERQLIINRKLRGMPLGVNSKRLGTLFGGDGQHNLMVAAMEKVKNNAQITCIPGEDHGFQFPKVLDDIFKQNVIFNKLLVSPDFENYLEAVRIDAARCQNFITTLRNQSLVDKINKIERSLGKRIMVLAGTKGCAEILLTLYPDRRVNIILFSRLMESMPSFAVHSENLKKYLLELFKNLSISNEEYKDKIKSLRSIIAKDSQINKITEENSQKILMAFDCGLNSNFTTSQLSIYSLKRLIYEYPLDHENTVFIEIINKCNKLDAEEFSSLLADLSFDDYKQLGLLLKNSLWKNEDTCKMCFDVLKKIQPGLHRVNLLKGIFSSYQNEQANGAAHDKAIIVSSMLMSENGIFDGYGSGPEGNELFYCFSEGNSLFGYAMLNLKELKEHLASRRIAIANSNMDLQTKRLLLDTIDITLNPTLGNDHKKLINHRWEQFKLAYSINSEQARIEFIDIYQNFNEEADRLKALKDFDKKVFKEIFPITIDSINKLRLANLTQDQVLDLFIWLFDEDKNNPESSRARIMTDLIKGNLGLDNENLNILDKSFCRKRIWSMTYDEMKRIIKEQRQVAVRRIDSQSNMKMIIKGYNKLLRPDDKVAKIHEIRQLVKRRLSNDGVKDFISFVGLYKNLASDQLEEVFFSSSQQNFREDFLKVLVTLLQSSIANNCAEVLTSLRALNNEHLLKLLTACFSQYPNEPSPERKAVLVSKMIKEKPGVFDSPGKTMLFGGNYDGMEIYYSITALTNANIYNSDELAKRLIERGIRELEQITTIEGLSIPKSIYGILSKKNSLGKSDDNNMELKQGLKQTNLEQQLELFNKTLETKTSMGMEKH